MTSLVDEVYHNHHLCIVDEPDDFGSHLHVVVDGMSVSPSDEVETDISEFCRIIDRLEVRCR